METILETYERDDTGDVEAGIIRAFKRANNVIYHRAQREPDLHGMGCTGIGLVQKGDQIWLAHVGDSRAYRVKGLEIVQLTKDHSLVQHLVDEGLLDPSEMESHPDKNVILRSLGVSPEVEVELTTHEAHIDDIFLLCSDGLSGPVSREEMAVIVSQGRDDLDQACQELINRANARGGPDNITACLVRILDMSGSGGPPPLPPEAYEGAQ